MKLVYDYLNSNGWDPFDEGYCKIKKNGHYEVHGEWTKYHPYRFLDMLPGGEFQQREHIRILINNETIQVRVLSKRDIGMYGYLQTYDHIPRGEPDRHGYYRRSTDEEVIRYIKYCEDIFFIEEMRDRKLKEIGI